jgi:hypothetical protein
VAVAKFYRENYARVDIAGDDTALLLRAPLDMFRCIPISSSSTILLYHPKMTISP